MGALQAACELAIQRMTLYEEDAVEANTLVKASTKVSSKDPCKTLHTNNPNVSTLLWAQVLTIWMQSNNLIWGKCHKCISLGPTLNIIMIQLVAKFAQKMI